MSLAYWIALLASLWMPSSTLGSACDPPGYTIVQTDSSAEEVVAKYLAAIGGADAVKAAVSRQITYWVHMFGSEPYLMERSWTRPNSMRSGRPEATTYTLTEGDRSWRISPEGRRELPAVAAGSMSRVADIDGPLVDPVAKGVTLAYSGVVHYDMTELHQVTATFADGVQWQFFFDAGTGLLRKMTQPSFRMLNGEISRGSDSHHYHYDYRSVGGVLYPHHWIQCTEDHTHLFVVEDIQVHE